MSKTINLLRSKIASFIAPQNNSMDLARDFLKYGNKQMTPDWSHVVMNDKDLYTGYSYAAIKNRANRVAFTAMENIRTESNDGEFTHPYLDIISKSPTFTDFKFWTDISTYLDLEGVYYIMAIRNFNGENRYGSILEFKLLNPYNIRRVMSADKLEVEGYIENRNGYQREIPKEMIIEIRELNPFDDDVAWSLTDAAKENQFTLKTAGDYTRSTLRNNINAPGILSTDVILPRDNFDNFIARVRSHVKGEPIFANGAGAVNWESMNTNLKDAALDVIQSVNRETLFTVAGVSKTIMGIEESGTTRDTARVQKELHVESQILPRIQLILDSLNQDYINHYPAEFQRNEAYLVVDNPMAVDHEAHQKEVDVKKSEFELYQQLIGKGYEAELSAQYVKGEVDIDTLGEPTIEIAPPQLPVPEEVIENAFEQESQGLVQQQEGSLKNSIINIEKKLTAMAIDRVIKKTNKTKNSFAETFTEESDVVTKSEKKEVENELEAIMVGFYGIVVNLKGGEIMRDRAGQYSMPGNFAFNGDINSYIKKLAKMVSESHVATVVSDIYNEIREVALTGANQAQIISAIKEKFNQQISETRAKTIARTETNRAFTRAQYEADKQFIKQNRLDGRAYKKWTTRSGNPCAFCSALASEGPIPFRQNFRSLGGNVTADGKTLNIGFESLEAGNAHPNCSCVYELIIQSEKNYLNDMVQTNEVKQKELKLKESEIQDIIGELDKIL